MTPQVKALIELFRDAQNPKVNDRQRRRAIYNMRELGFENTEIKEAGVALEFWTKDYEVK